MYFVISFVTFLCFPILYQFIWFISAGDPNLPNNISWNDRSYFVPGRGGLCGAGDLRALVWADERLHGLCIPPAGHAPPAAGVARRAPRRSACRAHLVAHVHLQLHEHSHHDGPLALLPQARRSDRAAHCRPVCIETFHSLSYNIHTVYADRLRCKLDN